MKKSFEYELVIKGCDKVFADDFSPGGFSKQTLTFDVSEKEAESAIFMASVLQKGQQFLESEVEVRIKEVVEEGTEKNNEND